MATKPTTPGLLAALLLCVAPSARADSLSRKTDVDFFHEVSSRNLSGLAIRGDGRLVEGPNLTELKGSLAAELLWCLEPQADGKWLVGTGPEGGIFEVALDASKGSFSSRLVAKVGDAHVFALRRLADGSILAGTSPQGGLDLVRDGRLVARTGLPVDSIFDIAVLDDHNVLVATGNPGRIYRVSLGAFAAAGISQDKTAASALAARGVTLFGEIRDRNVRRISILADGRVAAGSAPLGNVYVFPNQGGAPLLLQEDKEAEVTDILPRPDGGFYAAIVVGATPAEARAAAQEKTAANAANANTLLPPATEAEKFSGRSWLMLFPADGLPELLLSRPGTAFYRLAQWNSAILVAGGDDGTLSGYDPDYRVPLTFAGSSSARLNDLRAIPGQPGRFLVLRNNAPGLALLDWTGGAAREARTDRLDLGTPSRIGAVRFGRQVDLLDRQIDVAIEVSYGSDEREGWSSWIPLKSDGQGGWRADSLRGRYAKLRVRISADAPADAELGRAEIYSLPKDRPPVLQEFHFLPANYSIVPPPEAPVSVPATVGQLLQVRDDDRHRGALGDQVAPAAGMQGAIWSVSDPDGDSLSFTFSIRREGEANWTDVAVGTRDPFAQFDTSHLADGVYLTRLVATEAAPRPAPERLTVTFETDDLVVDHTPPDVLEASAQRKGDAVVVSVHGRDALSLLDHLEVRFNNGVKETVTEPADGINDGREKTFVLEEPASRAAGATSAEVALFDSAGNSSIRRVSW